MIEIFIVARIHLISQHVTLVTHQEMSMMVTYVEGHDGDTYVEGQVDESIKMSTSHSPYFSPTRAEI